MDENFLMHDSGAPERDEDRDSEEDEPVHKRVLVFETMKNTEPLCQSSTWFLDGIFKTAPNIFTQIFTILGLP